MLGRWVREQGVLALEEAVRRVTGMTADQFGQPDRGRCGRAFADLTIFDPERIVDRATFTDPYRDPAGVVHVVVNGEGVAPALTGQARRED